MSERYKYSNILKDENNKRYFDTVIYPKLEREVGDIYIISQVGDRLDAYADKYYGDVTDWAIIAQANHLGKGSLIVPPGIQIRIPINNTDFDESINNLNSEL